MSVEAFRFNQHLLDSYFNTGTVQEAYGERYTLLCPEKIRASCWPWVELRFREFGGKYSSHFNDTFLVEMGKISISPEQLSYTEGANTCFAGATFAKNGGIYIFHSRGLKMPDDLTYLIENDQVQGGIVGGWENSINHGDNRTYFEHVGMEVIDPNTDINTWFNIAALPKQKAVVYQYEVPSSRRY